MSSALPQKSLLRDDRGAMMLMSVFMATICIGMLYYLTGIGHVLTFRERMQDASDAGAMAGAITIARSMNVIAVLNIALALLFSLAVMANRVHDMIWLGAFAASSRCRWYRPGPCITALCLMTAGDCAGRQAERNANRIVNDNKRAIHSLANAVRAAGPGYGALVANRFVSGNYDDPVNLAVTVPRRLTLPTEQDSRRDVMCDQLTRGGMTQNYMAPINFQAFRMARDIGRRECGSGGRRYVQQGGAALAGPFIPPNVWFISPACNRAHGDTDPRPHRLTSAVGSGDFQFYSLATADDDASGIEEHDRRVTAPVLWGQTAEDPMLDLRAMANYSISQAEFYPHFFPDDHVRCRGGGFFGGSGPSENRGLFSGRYYCNEEGERYYEDDYIWTPRWRGRLRRTSLNGFSGICGSLGGLCSAINNLIAH